MRLRVLFAPELNQQRSPGCQQHFGPAHFGMAGKTERNHQVKLGATRYPVMHRKGALPATRRIAHLAAPLVPVEHRFPQTSKIFYILPLERVAVRSRYLMVHTI